MVEPLEARTHFARALYVTINRAATTVRGTDAAERLFVSAVGEGIDGEAYGSYRLGVDSRTAMFVNGERIDDLTIEVGTPLWRRPLRIKTGGGDDIVYFNGIMSIPTLAVDTGVGDDLVLAHGLRGGVMAFDAGAGDDKLDLTLFDADSLEQAPLVADAIGIDTGPGKDSVVLSDYDRGYGLSEVTTASIGGRLSVKDAAGGIDLTVSGLRVTRQVAILTAGSNDYVTLDRCRFLSPVTVSTGRGADTIVATGGTSFRKGVAVGAGGEDDDRVTGFPSVS